MTIWLQEQEGLSSVIGEEEFYEGDNPIEDVQKELDAEEELECDSSQEEEEEGVSDARNWSATAVRRTRGWLMLRTGVWQQWGGQGGEWC